MKKLVIFTTLMLTASLAQAELYQNRQDDGTISFSDRAPQSASRIDRDITHPMEAADLPGLWLASSSDGLQTELTLRENGSFVFDQSSDNSMHRVYMCGTWEDGDDALELLVKGLKRQLASGDIEQADRNHKEEAEILSAQKDRMILRIKGEQLIFNRAG
ncbi:MAG: DUF4124 domain-containing protein [Gammaproteobacteria bacterium]|nr:DUF4124 domain-containing protein [Gammaproteobacteria bacterium]NNF67215.1 DUF4124 domain-containing protein [Gammaproteobacteria bacterium]